VTTSLAGVHSVSGGRPLAEPPAAANAADTTDAELLRRHAAGDPDAFAELVRRHRDRLWAVALRTLGDREEAADALQDGLLSAYRAAGSYRGDAAVTTWLHRIVVNACLDRVRRRRNRPTVPLPSADRLPADPRDRLTEREISLEVVAALATLPVEQRAALVLVDVEGFPVEEAARILEVPAGTVKSRCARGRARLAETLVHLRPGRNPLDVAAVEPASRPVGEVAEGGGDVD
jgi:RNA polymerase sigma-70 factor (ECF subfamily)